MKRISNLGAVCAVGIAALAFQTADAEVMTGSMRNNANTCPWALLNINNDDCTYNNSNAIMQTYYAPDPWVGPAASSAFYASSLGTAFPTPGDGKVSPSVTADISVGAGNVVSGTITIENVAVHNFSAGASTGRGEEFWVSRTLTLAQKPADIVNGTTLIIGSAGYPGLLQPDPALPGLFGDAFTSEQAADSNGSTADILYWETPEPSGIGIATWETAGGAITSIGTTATQSSTGYGCNNAPNAGGDPCGSASALENRGEFENILLRIATDGAGSVTGVEGILVQEVVLAAAGGRKSWVAWLFNASAPTNAVDDEYTIEQDSTNNSLDVGANDINFENPTTATISTLPDSGGTATEQNSPGAPDGITVNYTPAAGFTGTETFVYTMDDSVNPADTATVTVDVVALGANDDTASTGVGEVVTIDVGANDVGFSDPTTAALVVLPANGNVVPGNSPGDPKLINMVYTPNPGFTGVDTFEYSMTDALASDTGTVTVTVADLIPVAPDTTAATTEGTPINIVIDDIPGVEFGNLPSTVTISNPSNGSATIDDGTGQWVVTYSPDLFFAGSDSIDYTIEDVDAETDTGTITITVSGSMPIAVADAITLAPVARQAIDVRQNDIPGSGPLANHTVQITQDPSHGTAVVDADQMVVYTPDDDFNGDVDTLVYTLEDETGDLSAPATVTITVTPFSNKEQTPAPSVSALDPWSLLSLVVLGRAMRRRRGLR